MTAPRKVVIGDATLYLGDARDVCRDFLDASFDMIFTDPPYGHNNNNGDLISRWEGALGRFSSDAAPRPILNDDAASAQALVEWLFPEARRLLTKGACICCCCAGGGPDPQFARWSLLMGSALEFKQTVIWDKGPMGMGWYYRRSYETVLVGMKPGAACKWYDTTNAVENIIRPGTRGIGKILPQAIDHPTPKPPGLAAHFMRLHTQRGERVLDPFMGGGSSGVAALCEHRRFVGIELEERWFDMACERIAKAHDQMALYHDLAAPTEVEQLSLIAGEGDAP